METAAEGNQQACGHVFLREPDGLGTRAVHIHGHFGQVEGLVDMSIGSAGNIPDLIEHAFGKSAIASLVGADQLDIDGRGEAKVQDLRDDVDRRQVERDAGVFAHQRGA